MDTNKINLNNGYKIIEASAGTGKTFTLAHLFLRCYLENQIKVDNILLLSFTNKTCNELKERIIERFHKLELLINKKVLKEDLDETIVLWYENQILENNNKDEILFKIKEFFTNVNDLKIFTFHGFCNNIIDNHSFEIKSPQGFILNNEIDFLYEDIINELWISEFTNLDENIIKSISEKRIKTNWFNITKINKSFFLNLLKEIDNENIFKFSLGNSDFNNHNISIFLEAYIKESWMEFKSNWYKKGNNLFLNLKEIGCELKSKDLNSNIYKSKPRNKFEQINNWIELINNNILKDQENKTYIYQITKSDLLTRYFYRKSIYKELDKFNIKFDISKFDDLQESIYKIKDGFYNEFIRLFFRKLFNKLINKKNEKGFINYSDIIKIVENKCLLDSEAGFSFKDISNKYKAVFIDEFQDTDQVQWRIMKKFFKDSKHLLICVGDPKQAIYKFRGGDIRGYLKAKNEADEIYQLDVNYRSSNSLVKIINKIYKSGLQSSKLHYQQLLVNSKGSISNNYRPVKIVEFSNEKYIEKLTINFLLKLLVSEVSLKLEDIAILTNNNYQSLSFKNLLNEYNIPSNLKNKINIFDTEASQLLILFLECLIKPNSSKNIKLLATSKFIQVNINKLVDCENDYEIDYLFQKFKLWNIEIKERGFISIFREFIIIFKSQVLINDLDLYSNLIQLSELIEAKILLEKFNLSKLITWYKYEMNSISRTCKGDEYLVKNNDSSGINLSTIHSSKGLEYKIVICPYLWDQKNKLKKANGPIWKDPENYEIYLNIENSCKKVFNIRRKELNEQLNELERLIYVALTRAKYQIIVFNHIENKENILNNNLLINLNNYDDYKYINDLEIKKVDIDLIKNKYQIKINNAFEKIFQFQKNKKKTVTNEVINIRSSYSSWIKGNKDIHITNLDKDYDENSNDDLISYDKISIDKNNSDYNYLITPNPLSDFPRGVNSGTCLHKILERFNFKDINNVNNLDNLIEEELSAYGIDKSFTKNIRDGLKRVIYSSLGEKFNNQRLIDIKSSDITKELKFDLPISINGKNIRANQLSKCFLLNRDYEFGEDYANSVKHLNINSRGFHSGCIDCLLKIKEKNKDSKWWIIDWKSNFLSNEDLKGSLPINYNYENMRLEMIRHHYPLQSHLYLLAVHRLLKWRLKNYNPQKDLGGYIYIFLRGLPSEKIEYKINNNKFPFGIFLSSAPLDRIFFLDKLFNNEV